MRRLKTMAAPFTDADGKQMYDGNYIQVTGIAGIFSSSKVVYERGRWWRYNNWGFFIDQANRYNPLTPAIAKNYRITDDRAELK